MFGVELMLKTVFVSQNVCSNLLARTLARKYYSNVWCRADVKDSFLCLRMYVLICLLEHLLGNITPMFGVELMLKTVFCVSECMF